MKPRLPLPRACPLCRAYSGLWRMTADGLARCSCERGRMLAAGKIKRVMGRGATTAGRPQAVEANPEYGRRSVPPVPMFDGKLAAAGKDE